MDRREIRGFIDNVIYDFETVNSLQQFERRKETLLIVDLICRRIENFQQKSSEGPYDLKGVFAQDFWGRSLRSGIKALEVRAKIADLSKEWSRVLAIDLRKLGYDEFISLLESWVLKNIAMLEKRAKSDFQKKAEKLAMVSLMGIVCAGSFLFMFSKLLDVTLCQNWGLKGEFYADTKFTKKIANGSAKTINFSSHRAMNKDLPATNFSVRWEGDLLIPKDGEYSFVMDVDDRGTLVIGPSEFRSADLNVELLRKSLKDNDGFKFQVGEFSGALRSINGLLTQLGSEQGKFDSITAAVDWMNSSAQPFQNYIKYLEANAPHPGVQKLLPADFVQMLEEKLKALALTASGQELKRAILSALYPRQTPTFTLMNAANISQK